MPTLELAKIKILVKKTCNDLSVVDYLILSSNIFSVIKNFDVLDYDPLFSDVHCALQFSFSVGICLLSAENRNISQPVNWDNCKKDEFVEYLTVNKKNNEIKNMVNRLDDMLLRVVKIFKCNKASGYDDIVNEHIKSTINIFLPIYCKLFNIVLNSGLIPESWSEGVIFPIYKNKGDTKDPSSYTL